MPIRYINGIIDLTDKGIGVRQSFLQWALQARWIDYNIDEQKKLGETFDCLLKKCTESKPMPRILIFTEVIKYFLFQTLIL